MSRSFVDPAWWQVAICSLALSASAAAAGAGTGKWCTSANHHSVYIPAGFYYPFFKRSDGVRALPVEPLCLDARPVTNAEFQSFVRDHPQWRKSRVKGLFAEETYLADWHDDLTPPRQKSAAPVTFVSWFAAGAYCEARGARLPTVAEWERIAGREAQIHRGAVSPDRTAAGSAPAPFSFAMGQTAPELAHTPLVFPGVWEWTADFNSSLVPGRGGIAADADSALFCGDGFRAVDASNYAAFLRHSFRSSLRAAFALRKLGFRCAQGLP